MYGGSAYGQSRYGGDETTGTSTTVIQPPLVNAPFTLYAPAVGITGQQSLEVPLISSSFQVFAPESVGTRSRPIAEDIRIMRVRRQ